MLQQLTDLLRQLQGFHFLVVGDPADAVTAHRSLAAVAGISFLVVGDPADAATAQKFPAAIAGILIFGSA
jgi:hypothetical protein